MSGASKIIENQRSSTYYDMTMSEEPSRYVFRVLALKNMMESPADFGFEIPKGEMYTLPKTKIIVVEETIPDMHAFAEIHKISDYQLRYLKPWIRNYQLLVKPGQKFEIKIPVE